MKFPLTNTYKTKLNEEYLFEYYDAESLEHLPKDKLSQVQIFAFHNDKFLIVNNMNNFNTYGPVGGSIEPNELPEECLHRELQEESNMRIIDFELLGYQRCTLISDSLKKIKYQIRYCARVEPIGSFTPDCDPDGDVTELLEIDPKDYKEYFDWQHVSDHLMSRSLIFLDSFKNNIK